MIFNRLYSLFYLLSQTGYFFFFFGYLIIKDSRLTNNVIFFCLYYIGQLKISLLMKHTMSYLLAGRGLFYTEDSYGHHWLQMVDFHWSLKDRKSPLSQGIF